MNTENKVTISQRIFTLVRDVPGLTTEDIHEKLSVDTKYKTSSGKQIIYRLLRAKYIRKDKQGKLYVRIDEYKRLPPFKKKKKVTKVSDLAAAAKLKQQQDGLRNAFNRTDPAMNAYIGAQLYGKFPKSSVSTPSEKRGFFSKLRALFK